MTMVRAGRYFIYATAVAHGTSNLWESYVEIEHNDVTGETTTEMGRSQVRDGRLFPTKRAAEDAALLVAHRYLHAKV
jgi:hypothetical protein